MRIATIESGSEWVPVLAKKMKKVYGQVPNAFPSGDPTETLRERVWVSPYYEDNLLELKDTLGSGNIIFGSDFPHAEGLADPVVFAKELDGFTDDEIRLVMRENALALSKPQART